MCVVSHVTSRRMDVTLYSGAMVDKSEDLVRFMLWNLSGQLLGFHQYRPNAPKKNKQMQRTDLRYYTLLSSVNRQVKLTAFGLELLNKSKRVCFLAEGVFDVAPLHMRGENALAMLCNDPKHLANWLRSMGYYLVALCDGDSAGMRLAKHADEHVVLPDGADPGDMPDEWFDKLVERYQ